MKAIKKHRAKKLVYLIIYSIVVLLLFCLDVHNDFWDDEKFKNL